jgi:hypothetical protein
VISGYTTDDVTLYPGVGTLKIENKPIKKGVFAKGDTWQYMFLCKNCMANSTITLDQKEEVVQLAYVVVSLIIFIRMGPTANLVITAQLLIYFVGLSGS